MVTQFVLANFSCNNLIKTSLQLFKGKTLRLKFHSLSKWTFHLSCRYEEQVYIDWTKDVGSISQENLDKALILRDNNTKLIKVNFDPQVCFPRYFVYILCTLLARQWAVFSFSTVTCYLHLSEVVRLNCPLTSLFFCRNPFVFSLS